MGCSVGQKYMSKCIGGRGSAPDHAGGAHDAPPDPVVSWGGGHSSPFPTLSAPRFSLLRRYVLVPPRGSLVPRRCFRAGYGPHVAVPCLYALQLLFMYLLLFLMCMYY